jgi:hypothetical protein
MSTTLNDTNVPQRLIWAVENNAHKLRHAAVEYLANKKEQGCMLLLQSRDWTKFAHENEQHANVIFTELNLKFNKPKEEPAQVRAPARRRHIESDSEGSDEHEDEHLFMGWVDE